MIIGLTGKNASGKGEVVNYLKAKGFVYYSLSDIIREEATKSGLEHTRDNLIALGNKLRQSHGPNYLAVQINNKIKEQLENRNKKNSMNNDINNKNIEKNNELKINGKINNKKIKEYNFVVDSIRSPYEAKELMKNKNFILLGIDAPIELRFKRILERNRAGDAKTLEEFKEQEQRENLKSNTNQQLDETFKLSKNVLSNKGTLEDLHKKIDDLLKELKCQE